jgi:glucosamine 6-phosphate synthetase-like amidotransferase/phosphosugar isomerase protein
MGYNLPSKTKVVMGHTRMTTQGSEKKNYNNHPFYGRVKNNSFALAHNGILQGDTEMRKTLNLPKTKIETDSYIAVQIIEKENSVTFDSLRKMAETVQGYFTFTVLDGKNNLYFVKGDSPIYMYHFADRGFYLYASTEKILENSLNRLNINRLEHEEIQLKQGDILRIDRNGEIEKSQFEIFEILENFGYFPDYRRYWVSEIDETHLTAIKNIAGAFGFSENDIDYMIADGFTLDEIEDFFYGDTYETDENIMYGRIN